MRLAATIMLAVANAAMLGTPPASASRALVPGTYELTLCFPACGMRKSHVGHGVLVVVADSLILPFEPTVQEKLRDDSMWMRRPTDPPPNACFRVTAQRTVGGREYYPGIIPAGLMVVRETGGRTEFSLYRSPDASFVVEVQRASTDAFLGQGAQHDWDGRQWRAGEVEGRRIGAPMVSRCDPATSGPRDDPSSLSRVVTRCAIVGVAGGGAPRAQPGSPGDCRTLGWRSEIASPLERGFAASLEGQLLRQPNVAAPHPAPARKSTRTHTVA